jgi:predicted amidohydrolase
MSFEFKDFSLIIDKICHSYLYSYSSSVQAKTWLFTHKEEWEKYYKLLSKSGLQDLKRLGRYDLNLRSFLKEYIFDINWIIYDLLCSNSTDSEESFQWIVEHQNDLINFKQYVDKEGFRYYFPSLRENKKLRGYLSEFFFSSSWMLYDLVYGTTQEKENAALWLKANKSIWQKNVDDLCLSEFINDAYSNPIAWNFYQEVLPQLNEYSDIFCKSCSIANDDINRSKDAIFLIFEPLSDKSKAWEDLLPSLIPLFEECKWNGEYYRRPTSTILNAQKKWILSILTEIFNKLKDKTTGFKAFFDLDKMSPPTVRYNSLNFAFLLYPLIPENERYGAWEIVLNFIKLDSHFVEFKYRAITLLDSYFKLLPEKDQNIAWRDIEDLLKSEDKEIVAKLIDSLGNLYPAIPQNEVILIFKMAHTLVTDNNPEIRVCVAESLGKIYPILPPQNQEQISEDLTVLIQDTDSVVSASAKYSSGTINIFHATQAKTIDKFQEYLEKAIQDFQSSLGSAEFFNQARFCYPFYKAYWNITFTENCDIKDIEKNLNSARLAQGNSDTRKNLVKIIKSLVKAEKNARQNKDLESLKRDFDTYRRYCDNAILLIKTTEKGAPMATKILSKGLPIIDKKIKKIISELQNEAKTLCKKTNGTQQEELGRETHKLAQKLSELDLSRLPIELNDLICNIEEKICGHIPAFEQKEICYLIKNAKNESDIFQKINGAISIINAIGEKILSTPDITISKKTKSVAKIATVQFEYELTNVFPPSLRDEILVKEKLSKFLTYAMEVSIDLILFPELCVKKEWIDEIKTKFPGIIIIFGSYYENNENIACIIYSSKIIATQKKITPSDFEDPTLTGIGMRSGPKSIPIFQSNIGKFSILICRDFGVFHNDFMKKTSLILVPSYNDSIERFYENANVHVTDYPTYILFSNAAKFGGTALFGQIKKSYFTSLIQSGYKNKDDVSYNLCSIPKNQEGMIIVDVDMDNRSPQVPTPMNPKDEKRNILSVKVVKISDMP